MTKPIADVARLVRCSGEIDLGNADEFQVRLQHALQQADRTRPVTVDLREVAFFGSAGVQALIQARRQCHHRNAALRVLPSKAVYRTLELVGMLEGFNLTGSSPRPLDAA